jgi:hypothetical protein
MAIVTAAIIAGIAGVGGAAMSADAAKNAAEEQSNAARAAGGLTNAQYNQTRLDQAPWRVAGGQSVGTLAQLLGIGRRPGSRVDYSTTPLYQLDARGVPQPNEELYMSDPVYRKAWDQAQEAHGVAVGNMSRFSENTGSANVDRWVRQFLPTQPVTPEGQNQIEPSPTDGVAGGGTDGTYGSLMRGFSAQDLQNDPVYQASYQSGLEMGRRELSNRFGGAGMGQSGAALKGLTRFATDYTAQRGNEAFNRFQATQGNQFGRLASLAGLGQTATNQVGAAGMQSANTLGNIAIGNANAQGASGIAQANAWNQGLGNISNWWQQQQLINSLNNSRNSGNYGIGGALNVSDPAYDPSLYYGR